MCKPTGTTSYSKPELIDLDLPPLCSTYPLLIPPPNLSKILSTNESEILIFSCRILSLGERVNTSLREKLFQHTVAVKKKMEFKNKQSTATSHLLNKFLPQTNFNNPTSIAYSNTRRGIQNSKLNNHSCRK